jgi:hypothetical protein
MKGGIRLEARYVIGLKSPGVPSAVSDALAELLGDGARQMLASAVEAEVQEFLLRHRSQQDEGGRQRLVRNGYLPERTPDRARSY